MELRDRPKPWAPNSGAVAERSVPPLWRCQDRRLDFSPFGSFRSEYAKMSNAEQGGTPLPVALNPRFPEASFKPSDGIRGL
jgi:hypothetical protein